MIASTTERQLRRCLDDVDFPASKDDLLAAAIQNRCDEETIGVLHAVAAVTYTKPDQVLAQATVVDLPDSDTAEHRT